MTTNGYDAAAIVKKYIELRDYVQEENKAHAQRMKAYTDAMEVLESAAGDILRSTGQKALSTDFGTAFQVPKLSVTCADKEVFLSFVRDKQAWHFLTAHVAKEAVEQYMEQYEGQVPPGIKAEGHIAIQFRRA
jgi:hypothetical protein